MINLLKDMKKIKEDAKTVTMSHPKGHTMIIAIKSLKPIEREALKRLPLAEGGEIKLKDKAKEDRAHYADDESDDGSQGNNVVSSDDTKKPPITVNVNQAPQQQATSPAAQQANIPAPVVTPNVQTNNPPVLLPNGSMSAPGAAQTGQEAVQGQQAIDIAKANAMVPVEQARLKAQQLNAQQDQDNINALTTHANNLAQNITKIDPKAYVKNMSAPAKVSTAIGLFLGGLSVPNGGHNYAQDFLTQQINNDIDAQKTNNENQKTIWGAYNSLYNNENMASNMTKASMAKAYSDQVDQIAAKLGTPQALVNAQKLKAGLAVTANKAIIDSAGNLRSTPNNPEGNVPGVPGNTNIQPTGNIQPISAPGNTPEQPPENHEFNILTPGAADKFPEMLKYDHTIDDREKTQMEDQMKGVSLAEEGLKRLDNEQIFEKLAAVTKAGGYTERLRRGLTPNALGALGAGTGAAIGGASTKSLGGAGAGAGVGSALGEAAGHLIPPSQRNNEYFALKQQLGGVLSSALAGRGDTFVREALDRFTPEYNDTPQVLKEKYRGLKAYIIDHTPHDALQRHGLAYK